MTLIVIDASELRSMAADLDNGAAVIRSAAAGALNSIADDVRATTSKRISTEINLNPSYVDSKLRVADYATADALSAVIEAPKDDVFLSRYGATQKSQSNVWTPAMFAEKFGSLDARVHPKPGAPKLPWTPRTGDRSFGRGIAPGAKAAGIGVSVARGGASKTISYVFFMPLRRGKTLGDGIGTFRRPKGSKNVVKAVKSLSVDQMARVVWRKTAGDIETSLTNRVLDAVSNSIEQELLKK